MAENKWVTGVINLFVGAITQFITGRAFRSFHQDVGRNLMLSY